MALRLIQIILPVEKKGQLAGILQEEEVTETWSVDLGEGLFMMSLMLPAEGTEALVDRFENEFSGLKGYRAIILEVLAFTPHPDKQEEDEEEKGEQHDRVSREELYSALVDSAKLSRSYIALMLLSVVVAAIGLFEDSVAIIIGAAVINPLLGPNMALSLATNLADSKLTKTSLVSLSIGIFIIVGVSFLLGVLLDVNPFVKELSSRWEVGLGEIVLAIASGIAAALLMTKRASASMIGVAVAVSLLPPLVTFGLLFGEGDYVLMIDPLLLFVTNLIAINLSGALTFYAMGIRPSKWWEADRAKRSTRIAIAVWALLLVALIILLASI